MKKVLLLLVLVLSVSCVKETATPEDRKAKVEAVKLEKKREAARYKDKIQWLMVYDFYQSDNYPKLYYYRVAKYDAEGLYSSDAFSVLKPKGFYKIGDTIQ